MNRIWGFLAFSLLLILMPSVNMMNMDIYAQEDPFTIFPFKIRKYFFNFSDFTHLIFRNFLLPALFRKWNDLKRVKVKEFFQRHDMKGRRPFITLLTLVIFRV